MTAPLSEAEIQYLIVLAELQAPRETPNNNHYLFYPRSEDEAGRYFLGLRLDWSEAPLALAARKLVQPAGDGWQLSPHGRDVAAGLRGRRPPIYYWYRQFYPAAASSQAYSEFCRRVYGVDLTQTGFSDTAELEALLQALHPQAGEAGLDVGCGPGRITEYLSERSGARFHGVDYCPEALELARLRTKTKRRRLTFSLGEMDALHFPAASFDVIAAIDSLYMPANLAATLGRLLSMLRPGGRLGAFFTQFANGSHAVEALHPGNTPLGRALQQLGAAYRTWDFSEAAYYLLQRKRQVAEAMRPDFDAESAKMLYDYILAESLPGQEPYDPAACLLARYLFVVEK